MVHLGKSREKEMYYGAKPHLFTLASEMRKNPTDAEKKLWNILRKYRPSGFIFRQQHPIYLFIADFYCHKLRLVIEVDGGVHFNDYSLEKDDGRTGELEKFGVKVIRFTNEHILNDQDTVIKEINDFITELSSPALPGAGDRRG
jgi:very-short-patch-repair endonuclease